MPTIKELNLALRQDITSLQRKLDNEIIRLNYAQVKFNKQNNDIRAIESRLETEIERNNRREFLYREASITELKRNEVDIMDCLATLAAGLTVATGLAAVVVGSYVIIVSFIHMIAGV